MNDALRLCLYSQPARALSGNTGHSHTLLGYSSYNPFDLGQRYGCLGARVGSGREWTFKFGAGQNLAGLAFD